MSGASFRIFSLPCAIHSESALNGVDFLFNWIILFLSLTGDIFCIYTLTGLKLTLTTVLKIFQFTLVLFFLSFFLVSFWFLSFFKLRLFTFLRAEIISRAWDFSHQNAHWISFILIGWYWNIWLTFRSHARQQRRYFQFWAALHINKTWTGKLSCFLCQCFLLNFHFYLRYRVSKRQEKLDYYLLEFLRLELYYFM